MCILEILLNELHLKHLVHLLQHLCCAFLTLLRRIRFHLLFTFLLFLLFARHGPIFLYSFIAIACIGGSYGMSQCNLSSKWWVAFDIWSGKQLHRWTSQEESVSNPKCTRPGIHWRRIHWWWWYHYRWTGMKLCLEVIRPSCPYCPKIETRRTRRLSQTHMRFFIAAKSVVSCFFFSPARLASFLYIADRHHFI